MCEPVHLYLPVSLSGYRKPVDWSTEQRLVYSTQQQFALWGATTCFPVKKTMKVSVIL